MFPTLTHIGQVPVFSYGVMTALGFLLAIVWMVHLAKQEGLSAAKMEGLGLVIVLGAGIGSKLLTALDYPGFYSGGWEHFVFDQMLGKGGVFYGGFLMATACSFVYFRLVKLPSGIGSGAGVGADRLFLRRLLLGYPDQFPVRRDLHLRSGS